MDNRGVSPLRIILSVAAVLSAIVLWFFIGQMGGVLIAVGIIVILIVALLFSRTKTPTD